MIERIRESVSGPLNQAELQTRTAEGWKLVAVEWERERADAEAASQAEAEVPFGLKVSGDCAHLEEDANEREVLVAMMELTIQDGPYSSIADELNRRGFRTREGVRWTPVSVFQMLPRLIEVGPKIFNSEDWQKRRERRQRLHHP
ncbi:MAG: recombinase family protein [Candidatus Korobacteraceae bacterium]